MFGLFKKPGPIEKRGRIDVYGDDDIRLATQATEKFYAFVRHLRADFDHVVAERWTEELEPTWTLSQAEQERGKYRRRIYYAFRCTPI